MIRLELAIAWRYLRSRRGSRLLSLISVIAMGGVIVGVGALILVNGVMTGLQTELREKILLGSPDLRVLTYGDDLTMSDPDSVLAVVRRQPGVVAAAPFVLAQAIMSGGHQYADGVMVMGVEPEAPGVVPVTDIRTTAVAGDFTFATADGRHRGVVLGERLAERLDVRPGIDTVTLFSLGGNHISPVTGDIVPHEERLPVTGVFRSGMYEYDNAYVFTSVATAQQVAQLGGDVTGLEVKTRTLWDAPAVASALADTLGYPYRTQDWQEQNSSLFQALKLEKLGMAMILLLIVLVAAFNIVSTLTMVVADKTREIGILRAMGMPARSIRRIFLVQGVVIGAVGTGVGACLGLVVGIAVDRFHLIRLNPQIYFIDHLPVTTHAFDVTVIVLASLAIAAVATIYPAVQAARLYPVEAIRHE
ncbi:MAG TPA: ABC transporter permease [Gemmatimonadaceae bacterium]|jgi:lipoprotein-releasing system permease protein|nr:ABC transporter permease [Gemmatimonadaceae bacterium]